MPSRGSNASLPPRRIAFVYLSVLMSPNSHEQQIQKALQLAHAGNPAGALRILREAIAQSPRIAPLRFFSAMLLHESGSSRLAIEELDQALLLDPHSIAMKELRVTLLNNLGRAVDAEVLARSVLAIAGNRPQLWLGLGLSLCEQGRFEEAIAALGSAIALRPNFPYARQLLVRSHLKRHQNDEALSVASSDEVLKDGVIFNAILNDFLAVGAVDHVMQLLNTAHRTGLADYEVLILLARLLHQLGRSSEALKWSEQAAELRTQELEPREMSAVSFIDRGDVATGLQAYKQLLQRDDFGPESGNRFLILSHYDPEEDAESLFNCHVDWVSRYVQPFGDKYSYNGSMTPDRRLRIGWISPRFSEGPVASFLKDTLSAFDRQQFEHILVSLGTAKDAHTAEFRRLSSEWVDAQALDDQALLGLLRSMNLDIAIDLAGHSFGNRLRVLAQRVAPLQICWLDYFNTTGVSSIDAWISDEWLTPLDSTQRYVESVYRLHSGRFCYSPPAEAPEPTRMLGGEPVFVSFNRLAKLNDKVIDTWSEILRRVPGSRLDLGASTLVDSIARTRVVERFAERDIKAERLGLYGTRNYTDLLEAYRQADIALDPFPFSGCTTTADALWMGLPVVTFPGNTFVSRQSASLLHRLKRPNWVASSVDEYVDCAATLAEMVDQLRKSRNSLREDVRRSICNSESQAREMAGLFRELWLKYSSLSTRN